MAQELYTGPFTQALGGADISWLVGLVVTTPLYYVWAKRTSNPPSEIIYPPAHPADIPTSPRSAGSNLHGTARRRSP
jgi:NCS1 family nucleobase:cation symporter-1